VDTATALLILNSLIVPAVFSGVVKLFSIERRLSHIEGRLAVKPRGD